MTPIPKTKVPTASGISRLLSTAGFTRAVVKMRGGRSGFAVASGRHEGMVTVRYCAMLGTSRSAEQYEQWHEQYAETIAAAGYATDIDDLGVIVTAKEG